MLAVGSFLFHAKAELYSYKEHKWRSVDPYPYAASLHSAATVYFQSTFVVIGGYENGGAGELDIVARLDTVTFEWDQLGRINYKRSGHSAIVSGETFYVVGGAGGKPNLVTKSKKWQKLFFNIDKYYFLIFIGIIYNK